ncbi:DUF3012 domain-containing protein [Endozoicomonas sp. G2_1]|uniref:DUF3012 domain-containing protein n=1 Tax=Endozoicomonas sp. G2_1 TaxID=2821091 RepID=UPI001ADBE82E|nr:DUF3012 domain-containing protein [Endozoicomonas sp. G2_1]MBO9489563.1 DUF3012 domain-containing protein [Endozoicomonas sp. G2_1]
MKKIATLVLALSFGLAGCAPEVGSKEWCEDLKEKDKGQWTAEEAKDFTKHCIF